MSFQRLPCGCPIDSGCNSLHESAFTPEQQLGGDLVYLAMAWGELGIDPDAFVKCGVCHEYFVDEQGREIPCRCDQEETNDDTSPTPRDRLG